MFSSSNNIEILSGIGVEIQVITLKFEMVKDSARPQFTYLSGAFSDDVLSRLEEAWGGTLSTSDWSREGTDDEDNSSLTGAGEVDFVKLPPGNWMVGCLNPDETFWPFI